MKRKWIKYITVAVSIALSAALMAGAFLLYGLLRGEVRESSEDPADYGSWSVPARYTKLLIFPEDIPAQAKQVEYYYKYESGWNRPMCQIYLSCTLSGEAYEKEAKRLSSLSWESGEKGRISVQRDETSFGYPAYVAIGGYDFCYEYALLDEEDCAIVYIYSMNTVEEELSFSREFLPDYFMEDFEELSVAGTDRFTMYGGYDSLLEGQEPLEDGK